MAEEAKQFKYPFPYLYDEVCSRQFQPDPHFQLPSIITYVNAYVNRDHIFLDSSWSNCYILVYAHIKPLSNWTIYCGYYDTPIIYCAVDNMSAA
jgi:hypothetical protein